MGKKQSLQSRSHFLLGFAAGMWHLRFADCGVVKVLGDLKPISQCLKSTWQILLPPSLLLKQSLETAGIFACLYDVLLTLPWFANEYLSS